MKFGVGQPVRRYEDLRLITGQGRYTDDIILPRMTHAFVLRSPVAHARIRRIDTTAARRMAGVLWVATGEEARQWNIGHQLRTHRPLQFLAERGAGGGQVV